MVKIRLKRMGAKKRPFYRLVVADSRSPRDGRFIELLGFYDPLPNPAKVQIDGDKVREWIRKGARPSDAARALLVQEGILTRVPRVFKPAPEIEVAPATPVVASEMPGAAEEVEAAEDAAAAGAAEAADVPEVAAAGAEPDAVGATDTEAVAAQPDAPVEKPAVAEAETAP